jgi:hypothetical protein
VSGRFGTMVGGLTMGRILIAQVSRMSNQSEVVSVAHWYKAAGQYICPVCSGRRACLHFQALAGEDVVHDVFIGELVYNW